MAYTDDGITLDYNHLQSCYPIGRGWSRFLKSKRSKAKNKDFVYYDRYDSTYKAFDPPVVTDLINLTSRRMLTDVPDFEEEYKLSIQGKGEKSEGLSNKDKKVSIERDEDKEVTEGDDDEESVDETNRWNLSSDEEDKKEKESKRVGIRRKVIRKGNPRRKVEEKKEVEEKSKPRTAMTSNRRRPWRRIENAGSENYLINRIPTIWPELEVKSMHEINKLYYIDPLSILK